MNRVMGWKGIVLGFGLVAVLAACAGESGSEPDTTAPTVSSTRPADGASGVAQNVMISAAFSEAMDGTGIDDTSFTLSSANGGAVGGTVRFDGRTATAYLMPSAPLQGQTEYIASLAGTITDSAGNALAPTSWRFTVGSRGWGNAEIIDAASVNVTTPRVAMDAGGNAVAVWEQEGDIWAARYLAGAGWQAPVAIEESAFFAWGPEVAVAANGDAVVVWQQDETDTASGNLYSHVLARRFTAGGGWGAPAYMEDDVAVSSYSAHVAMDASGNALVAWVRDAGLLGGSAIWANRYQSGSGWQGAEAVNDTMGMNPRVAFDADGNGLLTWWEIGLNGGSTIWASRHLPASGWQTVTAVASSAEEVLSFPQLALDADGNAFVVWEQYGMSSSGSSVWVNRYTAAGGWGSPQSLGQDSQGSHSSPAIAMNANGNAAVAWVYDDRNIMVIRARRYSPGGDWSAAETISAGVGNADSPQLGLDDAGDILVVWTEGDFDGRFSAWASRYAGSGGWAGAGLIENAGGDVEPLSAPRVAVDPSNGNAIAVWGQDAGGTRFEVWSNRFE